MEQSRLTDTNGGRWPMPVSAFQHFCVRVAITYPSDVNQGNNNAQTNFFNVTRAMALRGLSERFLLGNPYKASAIAKLVAQAPKGILIHVSGFASLDKPFKLPANKLYVEKLSLKADPHFVKARHLRDVFADISLLINSKPVGGMSFRVAKGTAHFKPGQLGPKDRASQKHGHPLPRITKPIHLSRVYNASLLRVNGAIVNALAVQQEGMQIDDVSRACPDELSVNLPCPPRPDHVEASGRGLPAALSSVHPQLPAPETSQSVDAGGRDSSHSGGPIGRRHFGRRSSSIQRDSRAKTS